MDKEKALELAVQQITKQHGPGSIMRMGEAAFLRPEVISTGALSLDIALGIGGMPRGRVVEIYGPESSGKTTLAMHVIAEAQRTGGIAAFIDAEHCFDPIYANAMGINVDELLISQPDTGEQALEIADMLIRSGALDVLVVDSVAALVPKAELEGEMGKPHMGLQARLMSQALRKLAGSLNRSRTTAIFINQLREKIGVVFGNPEITPGGRALKFFASVRIDVRRVGSIKYRGEEIGSHIRAKVAKNKMAPALPHRHLRYRIRQGHIQRGKHSGRGRGEGTGNQEWVVVLNGGGPARSRKGERETIPSRQSPVGHGFAEQDSHRRRAGGHTPGQRGIQSGLTPVSPASGSGGGRAGARPPSPIGISTGRLQWLPAR